VANLADIARFCDDLLGVHGFPDDDRALNGVQVDTTAEITHIAAAVDARERTIASAVRGGAQLLIAHHGLFWSGLRPLRGAQMRRFDALLRAGLGVYAAHLPLDAHPEIGNGALLAAELGLRPDGGFGRHLGVEVGVRGHCDPIETGRLLDRARVFAERYGGSAKVSPIGEGRTTSSWAIVTGAGAGSDTLAEAEERGVDTLIVGEGPHHTAITADEAGLVVIYAGHYATETLGVQALAARVAQTFDLQWEFVHEPTGL
jgi:dinuclear metal center YbgI/SA1388 family protein